VVLLQFVADWGAHVTTVGLSYLRVPDPLSAKTQGAAGLSLGLVKGSA
jgi:hypothetical protein